MNTKLVTAAAVVACALLNAVPAQAIEINGGASWGGWDDRGNSLDVGIWGSGSTTRSYELYTTVFTFAGNVFDPGPGRQQVRASGTPIGFAPGTYSTGAFANGNVILGIGARMNGASTVVGNTFVKFDLGSDSFQAASSLGAADGRLRAQLHAMGAVRAETVDEAGWQLEVRLPRSTAERLAAAPGGHPLHGLLLVGPATPT